MPSISIIAPDTTQALEEVSRRLGADAYILSTTKVNGQVEVKATNDPIPHTARRASSARKSFAELLEKVAERNPVSVAPGLQRKPLVSQSPMFQRSASSRKPSTVAAPVAASTAEVTEAPMFKRRSALQPLDIPAPRPETETTAKNEPSLAAVQETLNGLIRKMESQSQAPAFTSGRSAPAVDSHIRAHGFSDALIAEIRPELSGLGPDVAEAAFVEKIAQRLTATDTDAVLNTRNILVVGPSGSGRTLAAAKIAAAIMENPANRPPVLIAPRGDGYSDGQDLRGFARLLGLVYDHPTAADIPLKNLRPGAAILDLPSNTATATRIIRDLQCENEEADVRVVLVLPAGASRTLISRMMDAYGAFNPVIYISRLDECDMAGAEFSAIAEARGRIGWLNRSRSFTESLAPATPQDVETCIAAQNNPAVPA